MLSTLPCPNSFLSYLTGLLSTFEEMNNSCLSRRRIYPLRAAALALTSFACLVNSISAQGVPPKRTIIDNDTLGFYNEALGTILDGTQPQIPVHLPDTRPRLPRSPEPDISVAADILGDWLAPDPFPLNNKWSSTEQVIPRTWPSDTETAIIYSFFHEGPDNLQLTGNFGVDNGLFVWVDGRYLFGAVEPGGNQAFEYHDVNLGTITAGEHFIQVLLEDHGVFTGYDVLITGTNVPVPEPSTYVLAAMALLGVVLTKRAGLNGSVA